jgi:GT2 family glycosyltransferase
MDYSIIVPTNARPYCLERLLISLRHVPPPRAVIVGNSTPDTAPDWVHEWYRAICDDPIVRAIPLAPNRGPGGARRDLAALCESPYLLFLDDDFVLTPQSADLFRPLVNKQADIVGGVWLQDKPSDYGTLIGEQQARAIPLYDIVAPAVRTVPAGFTYSFSAEPAVPRLAIKTSISCSVTLDTLLFVDDLIPNIALHRDVFDKIAFDERFLYFFEWYDFFMQARTAGLRCATVTGAHFIHMPEPYVCLTAPHLRPREEDRQRFFEKWGILPLISGEA